MIIKQLPNAHVYDPPGSCIYCGATEAEGAFLTREHIIPFSLSGRLVFRKASCEDCRKTIHPVEEGCLRYTLLAARTHLLLSTRRPKARPSALSVGRFKTDDPTKLPDDMQQASFRWDKLPVADHPLILAVPIFERAGILRGEAQREGYMIKGFDIHADDKQIASPDGEAAGQFFKFSPDMWCRMIAKIAQGAAVAELGKDAFEPFLPPVILGDSPYASHYVGSRPRKAAATAALHEISLALYFGFIVAYVGLFSSFGLRPYEVVVGRARRLPGYFFLSSPNITSAQDR